MGFANHTNETRARILARVVSWRIGGILLAVGLAWLIVGDPVKGLELGLVYNAIRVVTHAIHDGLIWPRIRYGLRPSDSSSNVEQAR